MTKLLVWAEKAGKWQTVVEQLGYIWDQTKGQKWTYFINSQCAWIVFLSLLRLVSINDGTKFFSFCLWRLSVLIVHFVVASRTAPLYASDVVPFFHTMCNACMWAHATCHLLINFPPIYHTPLTSILSWRKTVTKISMFFPKCSWLVFHITILNFAFT